MPNYWRQLLIPWLMATVFQYASAQQNQNQQPFFEDLNKNFHNLLMQHHRQQQTAAAGFAANNVEGFRNPLGFDLRALHSHPLVFPPHAGFPPPPYSTGAANGAVSAGFGLPNGALPMPPPISIGGQQLVAMQPQPQLANLPQLQSQTIPFSQQQQQIGLSVQQEGQQTQFGQVAANVTARLPLAELTMGNGNFALAPLIQSQTQQQQQQKLFPGPLSILSTAQLRPIGEPQTNPQPQPQPEAAVSDVPPTALLAKTTAAFGNATTKSTIGSTTITVPPTETSTTSQLTPYTTVATDSTTVEPLEEGIDRLKLAQHMDKANLASLLHAANFSAGDARVFLKLVEKMLKDEVSHRLMEMQKTRNADVDNGTRLIFTEGADRNRSDSLDGLEDAVHRRMFSLVIPPIHREDEDRNRSDAADSLKLSALELDRSVDVVPVDNHQLNTVNTHLSYGAGTLEDGSINSDATSIYRANAKPSVKKEKSLADETNRNGYGVRIASNDKDQIFSPLNPRESSSATLPPVGPDIISAAGESTTVNYRTKEQADFDRLLEQLAESYTPGPVDGSQVDQQRPVNGALFRGGAGPSDENPSDSGLPSATVGDGGAAGAGFLNGAGRRGHRYNTRHPPHTAFEHLFEDYRFRLSGQNGVNDVIKALRNAHIGFYERRVGGRRLAAAHRSA